MESSRGAHGRAVSKLGIAFDKIVDYLAAAAGALILAAMLIVSVDVVMRYYFRKPMIWVSETTEMILMLVAFLGTAWLLRKEGHVRVDIIINRLKPEWQALLGIISCVIGLAVCTVIVLYGIRVTWEFAQLGHFRETPVRLPTAPFMAAIPLSGLLMFVQFARSGYTHLKRWRGL